MQNVTIKSCSNIHTGGNFLSLIFFLFLPCRCNKLNEVRPSLKTFKSQAAALQLQDSSCSDLDRIENSVVILTSAVSPQTAKIKDIYKMIKKIYKTKKSERIIRLFTLNDLTCKGNMKRRIQSRQCYSSLSYICWFTLHKANKQCFLHRGITRQR